MINIIRTKIFNKSDKTFLYRLSDRNITLTPKATIVLDGDLFSKETSQDGVTENILVAAYNGEIELSLVVDNDFIADVNRDSVVRLPVRSQVRLMDKSKKVEPKKEEKPVEVKKPEVKAEPAKVDTKVETPKVETPKVEATKPVEPKATPVKEEAKKVESKKAESKKAEALKDVKLDSEVEKL